jgi:hypothetical protein
MDTGPASFNDMSLSAGGAILPFDAYVSLRRDGSVWLRFGPDDKSPDWTFVNESRRRFQTFVLDVDTVSRLERFNYTDSCVLTDLELRVDSIGAWHPTFVNLFDPAKRKSLTALTKHNKECQTATVYGLTDDRQRLRCDGARHHNACGQRSLPDWQSSTKHDVIVKEVNFDPAAADGWKCSPEEHVTSWASGGQARASYTFVGSYYHVYLKMADCNRPKGGFRR